MIRLRVSTLEAFRRVAQTAYGDEAELVERLRLGQWAGGPSDWRMDAGTAWHRVLENPRGTERLGQQSDGGEVRYHRSGYYWFNSDHVAAALAHVGPGLCEVTGRKVWDVGGQAVEVEGTADLVRGLSVQDHKAKFSAIDAGDYEASLQWRFYLAIHEARWFRYNLFAFKDPRDGYCELRDIASFRFWPYQDLLADCRSWLVRFVDWADGRGLLPGLVVQPPRESAA